MKKLNLKSKLAIFATTLKEVFISSLPLAAIMIIVCGFIALWTVGRSMSNYLSAMQLCFWPGIVFGRFKY